MSDEKPAADLAPTPVPQPAELAGLTCVVAGRFALYQNALGGMEIFYDVGEGTVRKTVPGAIVKMAMGHGPMAAMMRRMMGDPT